jgi:hypothetical protein
MGMGSSNPNPKSKIQNRLTGYNFPVMTRPQATAEVFWTAFQALKPEEREAFIRKLMKDKNLAEDLRYAAVIQKRKNEPTVSLDTYLSKRSKKK